MDKLGKGERAAWGDFPAVIANGDLDTIKHDKHPEAKAGDTEAAFELVADLLNDDTVEQVAILIGDRKPVLVPVLAEESAGRNKIPLAMAEALADRLGLEVDYQIVQDQRVFRTKAGADHRLAFNPTFTGTVKKDQSYLLVDDVLAMGGTIASLRGYIENRGGKVIAATVISAHPGALDLAVKPEMLNGISEKHGAEMDNFWQETFGYGIDKLTNGEAGHLRAAASVDAIRDRVIAARNEGIRRLAQSGFQEATRGSGEQSDAEELERQQQAILETATVEQAYQATLVNYIKEKHDQVGRIEERLEVLVDRQQAKMQQLQSNAPGILSRPGARRAWNNAKVKIQTHMHTLNNRLEVVREIKEGMGVNSPRVEELATRKMRNEHPELAGDWDAMREAARRHQALVREKEREQKQSHTQERGRGQTLSIGKIP